MNKNKKKYNFWEIKASAGKNEADVFIYGEIVSGDKWDESDVSIIDFAKELDSLDSNVKTLNMYINSPGGSVFTTIAMMSQLERAKSRMTINAYIDGLAASAASFLIMAADNIYMYQNALLMVHKPMINFLFGANANVLRDKAEWLDKIESSTCVPAYKSKGTEQLTDEVLSDFLGEKDVWLNSTEATKYFDITVLEETKDVAANLEPSLLYGDVPEEFQDNSSRQISATEMQERQRIADEAKANLEYTKTILGGIL
ncbi:head maturation protease, ClpP-related [Oceanobacillus neutriphilus]|uniref:ATP-dependent Clp protease proteolytic subunit n=1 Tax=Oceanobacillus neutriphilus TaxID=531815 RepID=A0ABQ2P3Q3_9BACI|nr:head maturation protease, ClpP-related [Oceanobacillus neutriphilus]GGP17233.1 ATP-dependent Clp protease proteolytic subunit [Oceanobacillus neutriphilus]